MKSLFCSMLVLCAFGGFAQEEDAFVFVEGGVFMMGSAESEKERGYDETPHQVTLNSFYIGKYEVTQREYKSIMGTNPSRFKGDNLPVERVSWYDAIAYCNKKSVKEGRTPCYHGSGDRTICDWNANGYRLPTEAEWEYAAKGGKHQKSLLYIYSGGNNADAVGWHKGNSAGNTHPAGEKQANTLGLYDMSGNVWEWCWDWYWTYAEEAQSNPTGASSGSYRVVRGGSWYDYDDQAQCLRSAYRGSYIASARYDHLGFRVARNAK